jgi:hypothetical protein
MSNSQTWLYSISWITLSKILGKVEQEASETHTSSNTKLTASFLGPKQLFDNESHLE